MSNAWYYKFMGEEIGPLSANDLRQHVLDGKVTPETNVRRDGMDRWVLAESVKGLFGNPASDSRVPAGQNASPHHWISIACPNCHSQLRAQSAAAGRKAKCNECGATINIPRQPAGNADHAEVSQKIHLNSPSHTTAVEGGFPISSPPVPPHSASRPEEEPAGVSRSTAMALWSCTGVLAIGCVLFLIWYLSPPQHDSVAVANNRISEAVTAANQLDKRASMVEGASGQAPQANFGVGTPEYVVEQYLKATSWRERLQYVKRTNAIEQKMAERYENKPIHVDYRQINKIDSTPTNVGSIVTVNVVRGEPNAPNSIYYLEKTAEGCVILWEPSVGWLPFGWKAYMVSRPEQPMTFPLECVLADSYSGTMEKVNRTHYALEVKPQNEYRTLTAFVVRESPAGRIIFETLKDGNPHLMLLTIQFRKDARNILGDPEDCVWITQVISDKPYVYDENMASHLTSPILQQKAQEVPFSISEVKGCWVRGGESTGGERLIVPGLRFRITATERIEELRVKIVYQEKLKDSVEVIDEDSETLAGGFATSDFFEKGFSKEIISHAGRGYINSGVVADLITKRDVHAQVFYDLGDGYVELKTVPIAKVIGR